MKKALLLVLFIPILLFAQQTNNYRITIGEDVYYSSFTTTVTDSMVLYTYEHETEEQINYYNLDGNTWKFTHKDSSKNIDYYAVKESNKIQLYGKTGKVFLDKTLNIDKTPWKQSMSYSLSSFALSGNEQTKFCILRLDNFKIENMEAQKEGKEQIAIENKQYNAFKIKITASGFRSAFWHGHYWFRSSDGLFLKYEGLNGLPGSSKTVIEFLEKK